MAGEVYLDHAATTPTDAEVRSAMEPWLWEHFGNPSSRHALGVRTKAAIEHARTQVARAVGADAENVVFTSGATEANNIAILSHARTNRKRGRHVLVGPMEHPSSMATVMSLRGEGFEIEVAQLMDSGGVDFERRLRKDTVLVVQMLVNNVTGFLFPVPALSKLVKARSPHAMLHVDCVQGLGKLPISLATLGAHSLVISSHKVHGPKGCGALVLVPGLRKKVKALVHGGGHERGVRSGTENTPAIVGMGKAATLATARLEQNQKQLRAAYSALEAGVASIPSVELLKLTEPIGLAHSDIGDHMGQEPDDDDIARESALAATCSTNTTDTASPGAFSTSSLVRVDADSASLASRYARSIATLLMPDVPAEGYMNFLQLPQVSKAGMPHVAVFVGIGSACQARESKLSPALTSLGLNADSARRALRISISWTTLPQEVAAACAAIAHAVSVLAPKAPPILASVPSTTNNQIVTANELADDKISPSCSTDAESETEPDLETETETEHFAASTSASDVATDASVNIGTKNVGEPANEFAAQSSSVPPPAPAAAPSTPSARATKPVLTTTADCVDGSCALGGASAGVGGPLMQSSRTVRPYLHDHVPPTCVSPPDSADSGAKLSTSERLLSEETAQVLLIREDEHMLKCKDKSKARSARSNYASFQRVLVGNLKVAAREVGVRCSIERHVGRIYLHPLEGATCADLEALTARCRDIFGVATVSPCWVLPKGPRAVDFEEIVVMANRVLDVALASLPRGEPLPTFRTSAQVTAQNFFKLNDMGATKLQCELAARLRLGERGLKVKLKNPGLTLTVEVRGEGTFCCAHSLRAVKGLPVGASGKAICLLSGGIDSPVASWMMMSRGLAVTYVSFHSYPYLGEQSKQKLASLVRQLSRYQPYARLWIVPFTKCQVAIRDHCDERYRTVLYRRMMQRIATKIAQHEKAGALITGESLGQVASQTIQNMTCINAASGVPVLRPLVGINKLKTIELARKIGTYDVSIQPEPDCCTVFMPRNPIIHGKLHECVQAEEAIDVEGLMEDAVANMELYCELPPDVDPSTWEGFDTTGCFLCGVSFKNKAVVRSHLSSKGHKEQVARMKAALAGRHCIEC